MDEIIPNLWLGDKEDAEKVDDGFIVVSVADKAIDRDNFLIPIYNLWGKEYNGKVENMDAFMVKKARKLIAHLLGYGKKVLVHCDAGIDRSPFIVAKVIQGHDVNFEKAYAFVKKKHPQTFEHFEWR